MRVVFAYTKDGNTIRFEVEDDWTMTFGTAAGNRGMGAHELRVYSDGKKNQRMALTDVVSFWEESMQVRRVVVKPKDEVAVIPGQLSTDDFEEEEPSYVFD